MAGDDYETTIRIVLETEGQDGVDKADEAWTRRELENASERFQKVFRETPRVHGAAGWQMNVHAFRLCERLGFDYGKFDFAIHEGVPVLFDVNRTPTLPENLTEALVKANIDLARGLDAFLR